MDEWAKRSCGLSDEELSRLFANRPIYDDSLMPELSREEYTITITKVEASKP